MKVDPNGSRQQWVLLGAGHAHLQILRAWQRAPLHGVELTLATAYDRVVYSGMVPGVLSGQYTHEDATIDLVRLCMTCGVRLLVDHVAGLDTKDRQIRFAHQPTMLFDLASINLGAAVVREDLCRRHRMLVCIKPLTTFLNRFTARWQELVEQRAAMDVEEPIRLAVVGTGAAGIEVALCLRERFRKSEQAVEITLVDGRSEILPGFDVQTIRTARAALAEHGIILRLGSTVVDWNDDGPGALMLEDGTELRCDLAVWATGPAPLAVMNEIQAAKSDRGFLATRPTLQSLSDAPLFVVGDSADLVGQRIAKSGVYAVRQGPVLWRNLQRWHRGLPPIPYVPQRSQLSLLNCGDGTALLSYKGWTARGRWVWRLKSWIDQGFVRQFQP